MHRLNVEGIEQVVTSHLKHKVREGVACTKRCVYYLEKKASHRLAETFPHFLTYTTDVAELLASVKAFSPECSCCALS